MCLIVALSFCACNKKEGDDKTEPEEPVNYITYDEFKTYYTGDDVTINWDNFDAVLNQDDENIAEGTAYNMKASIKYRTVGDDKYIEIKSEAEGKKGEIYAHNADTYVLIKNSDGTEYLKKKSKINIFEAIASGDIQLESYVDENYNDENYNDENDEDENDEDKNNNDENLVAEGIEYHEWNLIRVAITDLDQLLSDFYTTKEKVFYDSSEYSNVLYTKVSKTEDNQKLEFKLASSYKETSDGFNNETFVKEHKLTFTNNNLEKIVTTYHAVWYTDSSNISATTNYVYDYVFKIQSATGTIEMPTDLDSYEV